VFYVIPLDLDQRPITCEEDQTARESVYLVYSDESGSSTQGKANNAINSYICPGIGVEGKGLRDANDVSFDSLHPRYSQ
jgi:hypothetical protein